jgi:hypothetical protein
MIDLDFWNAEVNGKSCRAELTEFTEQHGDAESRSTHGEEW